MSHDGVNSPALLLYLLPTMSWALEALEADIAMSRFYLTGQEQNIGELEFLIGELKDLLDLATTTQKNPDGIKIVKSPEDLAKVLWEMKR